MARLFAALALILGLLAPGGAAAQSQYGKPFRPASPHRALAPKPARVAKPRTAPKSHAPAARPHQPNVVARRGVVPFRVHVSGTRHGYGSRRRSYRGPYHPRYDARQPRVSSQVAAQTRLLQRLTADLLGIGPGSTPGGPQAKALARDLGASVAVPFRFESQRLAILADDLVAALAHRRPLGFDAAELARDLILAVNAPQFPAAEAGFALTDAEVTLQASGVPHARIDAIAADLRNLHVASIGPAALPIR